MFKCPDKTTRFYLGRATSYAANRLWSIASSVEKAGIEVEGLEEFITSFMDMLFGLVGEDVCNKNWQRFEQFFKCLADISKGGILQVNYMVNKIDAVKILVDFMLCNDSPLATVRRTPMGAGGMNEPKFTPIVELVSKLVRHCTTPEMAAEEEERGLVKEASVKSEDRYDEEGNLYEVEQEEVKIRSLLSPLGTLSEEALLLVQTKSFIEAAMADGDFTSLDLPASLAHLCYKNIKTTKRICKCLLAGINRNNYDSVNGYLEIVTEVCLIKDQYQLSRLEYVFGVPQLVCKELKC
jgi:hypothetical protein